MSRRRCCRRRAGACGAACVLLPFLHCIELWRHPGGVFNPSSAHPSSARPPPSSTNSIVNNHPSAHNTTSSHVVGRYELVVLKPPEGGRWTALGPGERRVAQLYSSRTDGSFGCGAILRELRCRAAAAVAAAGTSGASGVAVAYSGPAATTASSHKKKEREALELHHPLFAVF